MTKIDLKKTFKNLFNPSKKEPSFVDVPEFKFLMIDGEDARPESEGFQNAIQALFSISYKTKFSIKKSEGKDYAVMPLEGLWWSEDMDAFINGEKEKWKWTLMIHQPDFVSLNHIQESITIAKRKGEDNPALDLLRMEPFTEGPSAQIMHIGPFSEEYENIMKIHRLIESEGYSFDGKIQKHHEIYLSDFRRTAPEKLKTVLRQPFQK